VAAKVAALRRCQLRRLLAAELASTAGNFMVLAALPFAVLSIGGTIGQVGLALGCQAAAFGLVLLVGGTIGDRLSRRSTLVGADLVRFLAQAVIAILLLTGEAAFWQLLVAEAALGVGTAFFMPAMTALMPEVVPSGSLLEANALRGIVTSVGGVLGPALAAMALAASDPGWAFAVDALSFLASAALLVGLRLPDAGPARTTALLSDLIEGWAEFRRRTWAWVVVLEFGALNALVFAPFFVLGPTVAADSLGGSAAWAAILAAMGLGELAGGLLALWWRPGRPLLAGTLAMGLWIAPLLLLASAAPIGLIVLGAAAAGASLAIFAALWQTTLQTCVPAALRSRLSSYDLLGSFALLPLGYLLGGVVETTVGATAGLTAAAAILAGCTVVVASAPSVRSVRFSAADGGEADGQVGDLDGEGKVVAGTQVGAVAALQDELGGMPGGEGVAVAVQLKRDPAGLVGGEPVGAARDEPLAAVGGNVEEHRVELAEFADGLDRRGHGR
jgi:MFS family permease